MNLFFQHLLFLIQTAQLLFAEHTNLFLLLLPLPSHTGPGLKILSQHVCHVPCCYDPVIIKVLLEIPLPKLRCKRDHMPVTIIRVLLHSKYERKRKKKGERKK